MFPDVSDDICYNLKISKMVVINNFVTFLQNNQ